MDKKVLSERDICTKYIAPAVAGAGWDVQSQVREEVTFTDGRVFERGRVHARGPKKRADYILSYTPNLPLALIEAKDNRHGVGAGMPQALEYADALDIPFVYASNGDAFLEHDRTGAGETVEREIPLDAFPSPDELWRRYRRWKGLTDPQTDVVLQDYYTEAGGREPRYYQRVAVNRAVEAVARGQDRLLLVMATGTGKTYTAFQIIWRLWKAGRARRVLFLADRNVLVDQTMQNDFRPFGDAMVKVRNRAFDPSYEIHLALYQAISGTEEAQNVYRHLSPDFFDLVVVDECHRGSAADDSAWREILDYFAPAVHLGLTATPKETEDVSTSHTFGEPVYTYSLRQGIEDGFLAPYRVVRVHLDRDVEGWRPPPGTRDKYGHEVEDRVYSRDEFDRLLVIDERTQAVAERVTAYLRGTDRFAKTIVFCVDIDHAERLRSALVNANADLARENPRYVARITGDSDDGVRELDAFIDPESRYPVVVTTSQMLTTGVDAQTCRLIVLDRPIGSMTEFKQIIGRGTRLREDYGKRSFTILDFRDNTRKFADPDFDGDPVRVYVVPPGGDVVPPDEPGDGPPDGVDGFDEADGAPGWGGDRGGEPVRKYHVNGVDVRVLGQRVQVLGPDGRLVTESLRDYTRHCIEGRYRSLDDFLTAWTAAERKAAVVEELAAHGVLWDELESEVGDGLDPFDVVCHIAYGRPPSTRRERAERVRIEGLLAPYGEPARAVLDALLDAYADEGVETMEAMDALRVRPLSDLGSPVEIVSRFGGKPAYVQALRDLTAHLYRAA